jgi:hypothetical protein
MKFVPAYYDGVSTLGSPLRAQTAEEPGPLGSAMFIKRHATELRDCVAVLNTYNGAGRPRGRMSTAETISPTPCVQSRTCFIPSVPTACRRM